MAEKLPTLDELNGSTNSATLPTLDELNGAKPTAPAQQFTENLSTDPLAEANKLVRQTEEPGLVNGVPVGKTVVSSVKLPDKSTEIVAKEKERIDAYDMKYLKNTLVDRVERKIGESEKLKSETAKKLTEIQGNLEYPMMNELGNLYAIEQTAKAKGFDTASIRQQIEAIRNAPVDDSWRSVPISETESYKLPTIKKSKYNNYGEMFDATSIAENDFSELHQKAQRSDGEVAFMKKEMKAPVNYVSDGKDEFGNEYMKLNPLQSMVEGFDQSMDVLGIWMMKTNPIFRRDEVNDRLKRKYVEQTLFPKMAEGSGAHLTEMLGSVGPIVATSVFAPQGVAALALNALTFGALDMGSGLVEGYSEAKNKGASDEEAMDFADKIGLEKGAAGTVLGATMPLQGAGGTWMMNKLFVNKAEATALRQFLGQQTGMVPSFMAKNVIDNAFARSQGSERNLTQGTVDAGISAFIIAAMTHSIANVPKMPEQARSVFEKVIAKNFTPELSEVFAKGTQDGIFDYATTQRIQEKANAYDVVGKENSPEIEDALLQKGERLNLLSEEIKKRKAVNANADVSDLETEMEVRKQEIRETKGVPLSEQEQVVYDKLKQKEEDVAANPEAKKMLPFEKDKLAHFERRMAQGEKLAADEAKRIADEEAINAAKERPEITISEVIDAPITYNGERGTLTMDGQMVVARVGNREYEIGTINEVNSHSAKDYGIEQQQSVVFSNELGNVVVRGDEFVNNFSDPLAAINYDADGNIVSVNLETPKGEKRTFRGDIAEDVAYQLTLKDLAKRNEFSELELNIKEDGSKINQDLLDAGFPESAERGATESDETLQREKAPRRDRAGTTVELPGGERTGQDGSVDKTTDAGNTGGNGIENVESPVSDLSSESGIGRIQDAANPEGDAVEGKALTKEDIHSLADEAGIKWDGDANFMAKSKELTGVEHLDEMNPEQLQQMGDWVLEEGLKKDVANVEEADFMQEVGNDAVESIGSKAYREATHPEGRTITKTIADGTKLTGTYKIVSADDVIASHNEETFSQSEGYPTNESGTTINDRDYSKDTNAQTEVIRIAQSLDDRAISQTPVVTKDGIVIDGNNRTMSRKLAAKNGTDGAYLEALREQAELHGLKPEDVDAVKNPMLIFEPKDSMPYDTKTLARFNKSEKKEKSPVERAVEVSKTISDKARRVLGDIYSGAEKPSDVTSNPKIIKEIVKILQDEGIVQSNELPRYFDVDKMTATKEGVAFMESLMVGSALNEKTIRLLDNDNMGGVRQKLLKAIVPLTQNAALGDNALTKAIEGGIDLVNKAKQGGQTILDAVSQLGLHDARKYSPDELAMASYLDGEGFGKFLERYNGDVGKEVLFEGALTKDKIIDNALRQKFENYEKIRQNLTGNDNGGKGEAGQDNGRGNEEPARENKPGAEEGGGGKEIDAAKKELNDAWKEWKDITDLNKMGVTKDPKKEAEIMYRVHKALVKYAIAYIKDVANDIKKFAKTVGISVKQAKQAWDEATGVKTYIKEELNYDIADLTKTAIRRGIKVREKFAEYKAKHKDFQDAIKDFLKDKELHAAVNPEQVKSLVKRAVEVKTEKGLDKFLTYTERVINDANYSAEVDQAVSLSKELRKKAQKDNTLVNNKDLMAALGRVPVKDIENVGEYNEIANEYLRSQKPVTDKDYKPFDNQKAEAYLEKVNKELNDKYVQSIKDKYDLANLTPEEAKEVDAFFEAENEDLYLENLDEAKRKTLSDKLQKIAAYSKMSAEQAEFTGFSDRAQGWVKAIKDADLSLLGEKAMKEYIRTVDNAVINNSNANLGKLAATIKASEGAKQASELERIKALDVNKFEKAYYSLPMILKTVFGTSEKVAKVRLLSGMEDVFNGGSKANNATELADTNYQKFKKENKVSDKSENNVLRQVYAYLIQHSGGTAEEIALRFEDNKNKVQQSIDTYNTIESKKKIAELAQKAFDKFKDAKTPEEVKAKMESISDADKKAVEYWQEEFGKTKEDLRENTEAIHNEKFNDEYDYTPYTVKLVNRAFEKPQEEVQSFQRSDMPFKPKQSPTTLKRSKSGKLNEGWAIDFDFDANMINKYQKGQYDIQTSEARTIFREFIKTKEAIELFGGIDNVNKIADVFNNSEAMQRGAGKMDSATGEMISSMTTTARNISTSVALGGFTQWLKQYPAVGLGTLVRLGTDAPLLFSSYKFAKDNPIFDKFTISERAAREGGYDRGEKLHDKLSSKLGETLAGKIGDTAKDFSYYAKKLFFTSLREGDVAIAKRSWIAYYLQSLKKQGVDLSTIDPATEHTKLEEPERKLAAAYAEQVVKETQIPSNPAEIADLQRGSGNASQRTLKDIFMPFSTFSANLRSRMINDAIRLKSGLSEDRVEAAKDLTATVGEIAAFHAISVALIGGIIYPAGKKILYELFDIDDKEKTNEQLASDMEFKIKKWYSNMARDMVASGFGTIAENGFIDAANRVSYYLLSMVGSDKVEKDGEPMTYEEFSKQAPFYRYKKKNGETDYGLYQILLDKPKEVAQDANAVVNGEYTEEWYGKERTKELTTDEREYMGFMFVMDMLASAGLTDADLYRMSQQTKREMLKNSADSNLSPEDAKLQMQKAKQEFKNMPKPKMERP